MTDEPIQTGEGADAPGPVDKDEGAAAFAALTKAQGWLALASGLGAMIGYFSKHVASDSEARRTDQIVKLKMWETEAAWQAKDRAALDDLRRLQREGYEAERDYWRMRREIEFQRPVAESEHQF
jgi:hypothetical protein